MVDSLSPQESNNSSFPVVVWTPEWPVRNVSRSGLLASCVMSVAFFSASVVMIVFGFLSAIQNRHIITLFGMLGMSLLFIGVAAMFTDPVRRSSGRPRPGVRCRADKFYGSGVVLNQRKIPLALFITLGGCCIYGFMAWIDWRKGIYEDGLLPISKNSQAGATWILILSLVAAACVVFFAALTRRKTYLELYPSGIRRVIDTPIGLNDDTFIEWSEIASLEAGTYRPSARSNDLPKIDVHLKAPRQFVHPRLDQPNLIMLPIHVLVASPNTVMAIVRILLLQPETRDLLARSDAGTWFTPPTMSEQRRLSLPAIRKGAAQ